MRPCRKSNRRAGILPCALLFLAPLLSAQVASLHGLVTDETGALVPAARVTVTAKSGNPTETAVTDSSGSYRFNTLAPGVYTVTATAAGLATVQPQRVTLREGSHTLDLALKITTIEQQLTVRDDIGPSVSVEASSNASALVLKGDDLEALADNPDDLAADLQALAGPSAGPGGGSLFVDGFSGGEIPPKESIREIRINQNPFSPEFDKLGYGRIEIFTKPGADKYHGTIDYNLGTDRWNTRNPYASTKAPLLLNEFEGGGGGPLGKRASFTLDGQRNLVDNGFVVNAVTLNPQTFAVQPFSAVYTTPQRFTRLSPRLDYALSQKHTLSVRYSWTQAEIDGAGIGAFDLPSRGYRVQYAHQLAQITETSVLGSAINETRFQFYRDANNSTPFDSSPSLQVLGAFNGNGSQIGLASFRQNDLELQNITSMAKGAHFIRFGVRLRGNLYSDVSPNNFNGTFTFGGGLGPDLQPVASIERYRRTRVLLAQGLPPDRIRALGGGATQFSIGAGNPAASVNQMDLGLFAGDEWRLRPNLTVSLGVRYEAQTNMSDWRDIAPRIAIAWSPKFGRSTASKTVLRAGFGTFYDRFALANTLTAQRFNGIVQQQYVVADPDFFPAIPTLAALANAKTTQVVERVASDLRAPYLLQTVVSLERQLPAHTTLALTYTNARGLHLLRSRALPLTATGPVFLMESSGIYNQNQFIANITSKINSGFSLFSFYVWNRARSSTDGVSTFIANPSDDRGEYGPASTDIHHRLTLGGSLSTRWNLRISPFVILQSGPPFDITVGRDLYGTTLFNGRPGIATDPAKAGVVRTEYGLLDPNPTPGEPLLPRNYGRGPGQQSVNLRIAKTVGFGPSKETSASRQQTGGGSALGIPGGGQLRNIIGAPTTSRRYNLIVSMSIRNLLNHNNPGPITGDLTSPLFGRANRVAGNVNGEGFSENASNRRLELQLRLNF